MMQAWIVGALVAIAAAYSLWYVLPAVVRKQLGRVHQLLGRGPSCAACSDCGKCASPAGLTPQERQNEVQVITFHRKN